MPGTDPNTPKEQNPNSALGRMNPESAPGGAVPSGPAPGPQDPEETRREEEEARAEPGD